MTAQQRENFENALVKSFNIQSLRVMLVNKLGIHLDHEVDINAGFRVVVNRLFDVADQGEWTEELLRAAYAARPVTRIKAVMHDLQIFERESVNAATKTAVVSINEKTEVAALEKIVNTRTSFVRFIDYLQSFRNIGSQICRIEFPIDTPQGTGWLVAPDLVLTNYHVMEAILDGVHTSDDVICRFDYFSAQQGFGEKEYHLGAEDWCLDKSKYAQSDIGRSQADPTPDELDYILFRLKGEAGNDILPSGAKRGWIKVSENPVAILPGDIVVVPQHPRGRSLELAFGNVLSTGAYNSSGNRLRYDANTDHGSSGSPVFNIELKPFGLHHAGKVSGSTGYNQCVPIREIINRMKANASVPKFWMTN